MRHGVTTALMLPMLLWPHAPRVVTTFNHDGVVLAAHAAPAGAAAPVADAAMQGDLAALRTLLAKGVDVNAPQGDGMTALHWAAQRGDSVMAGLLLRSNASVRAVTRIGAYQPLHIASSSGSTAIVKQLLAAKADVRAVTIEGVTPLHLAAMSGVPGAVTALVKAGADVNALEPGWNQSPLMLAAARGRFEAVRVLMKAGANPSLVARTMDIMASAAQDRQAKMRRDAVLQQLREKQGQANNPNWLPTPEQVHRRTRRDGGRGSAPCRPGWPRARRRQPGVQRTAWRAGRPDRAAAGRAGRRDRDHDGAARWRREHRSGERG